MIAGESSDYYREQIAYEVIGLDRTYIQRANGTRSRIYRLPINFGEAQVDVDDLEDLDRETQAD